MRILVFFIIVFILLGVSTTFAEFGTSRIYILIPEGCFPPSSGDWNITQSSFVLCQDKTILLNGSLTVYGLLTFKNVTLLMNNAFNGEHNITAYGIGTFSIQDKDNNQSTTVDASNITAYNTANRYELIVQNGAIFELLNSFLSYAGWNATNSGLRVLSDSSRIANSTISNNYFGISYSGSGNNTINNSTISFSTSSDFYLASASIANSTNTNFNQSKITVLDTSNLTTKWFLDVLVTDTGLNPLSAATVTIYDSKSALVFSGSTTPPGRIPTQTVVEFVANNTTNNFFTPHTIMGSKSGYNSNTSLINVTYSQLFTLILPQSTTPPIIIPPGGGGGLPLQQVTLDTTVKVESGSEQVIPGQRVYATITLVKGGGSGIVNVNLTYFIRDPSGNTLDYREATVAVDTIRSDIYYLTLPPDAPLGVYTFRAVGIYDGTQDTSVDTFQVVRNLPPATLSIKSLNVPLMFTDQHVHIIAELENTGDAPLDVNTTFFLPPGFDDQGLNQEKTIESGSSEIFLGETTPRVFGIYTGFISIKYGGRGLTKEFTIFVLPTYLLLIPLIFIFLVIIIWKRRKKEKKYIRPERVIHIRRMIGR